MPIPLTFFPKSVFSFRCDDQLPGSLQTCVGRSPGNNNFREAFRNGFHFFDLVVKIQKTINRSKSAWKVSRHDTAPSYAFDDKTAIKVTDNSIEIITEGTGNCLGRDKAKVYLTESKMSLRHDIKVALSLLNCRISPLSKLNFLITFVL
jgi:hypothetical protein